MQPFYQPIVDLGSRRLLDLRSPVGRIPRWDRWFPTASFGWPNAAD
jgi:hypothetical protein